MMKSHRSLASVPAFLAAIFLITACKEPLPTSVNGLKTPTALSAAVEQATQTQFSGLINFCANADLTTFRITPGATLHFKGDGNQTRWVTGNPLIDGFEQNAPHANINLKNGSGVVHLDVSLKPDAVNGTWEIRQQVKISEGAPAGSTGVGHGTGDLQGMTIKFTTEPPSGAVSVCNPEMPAAAVNGVILSPAMP
jgi:hypothetical protein